MKGENGVHEGDSHIVITMSFSINHDHFLTLTKYVIVKTQPGSSKSISVKSCGGNDRT